MSKAAAKNTTMRKCKRCNKKYRGSAVAHMWAAHARTMKARPNKEDKKPRAAKSARVAAAVAPLPADKGDYLTADELHAFAAKESDGRPTQQDVIDYTRLAVKMGKKTKEEAFDTLVELLSA